MKYKNQMDDCVLKTKEVITYGGATSSELEELRKLLEEPNATDLLEKRVIDLVKEIAEDLGEMKRLRRRVAINMTRLKKELKIEEEEVEKE